MENKYLTTEQSKAKELEKVKEIEEDKPKEVSLYWYIWCRNGVTGQNKHMGIILKASLSNVFDKIAPS